MSSKGNYSRYFVILQEDEKGYSSGNDKFPTGYAKIEKKTDKCKISYYVQNLKKSQGPYYMVLICNKKNEKNIVKLGKINLDQYGRSDVSVDYDSRNIGDCKVTIDKVRGAAIVKFIDTNMVSVLSGFVNGNALSDWKTYPISENKDEREESSVNTVTDVGERNFGDVRKDKYSEEKEQKQEGSLFDEYEKSIEESKQKDSMPEEKPSMEYMPEEEKEEMEIETEEKVDIEVEDDKDYADCPKGSMGKFFMSIAEGFEEVSNFHSELGKCKWYKIKCTDMSHMNEANDYNKYTVAYYPMMCYFSYIKKYGHYLMGYKCNKKGYMKYIVYAIPGKKNRREQPFEGRTGFVTWVPGEEMGNGYWLMFYDFKNSCVVIPVK